MLRVLVWAGLAALAVGSAMLYPTLPESIPQHIGADGKAGNFAPRSPFSWGAPVLIAAGLVVLLEVIRALLPTRPALFNFPGKEQLLRLPAEYRSPAIARMQRLMDVVNLQLLLTFVVVQWMIWRGAQGIPSEGLVVVLLMGSPLLLVITGLMVSGIQHEVDRAQREYESRRNPLEP
jgi:uncharacterized membrane protein